MMLYATLMMFFATLMMFFATLMTFFARLMILFATLMTLYATLMMLYATLMMLYVTLIMLYATLMMLYVNQIGYLTNFSAHTCLYCGLVAPNTDLTYVLTSLATSTSPILSLYIVILRATRALLRSVSALTTARFLALRSVYNAVSAATFNSVSLGAYAATDKQPLRFLWPMPC